MTRRVCLLLILAVAVCLSTTAVAQEHPAAAPAAKATFDKAIMQKVWDAWHPRSQKPGEVLQPRARSYLLRSRPSSSTTAGRSTRVASRT